MPINWEVGRTPTRHLMRGCICLLISVFALQICSSAPLEAFDLGKLRVLSYHKMGSGGVGLGTVAVDVRNNYFVAGDSNGSFGNGPSRWGTIPATENNRPPWSGYLVKYDRNLNCLWSQKILNMVPQCLAVSGTNDLFVAGTFENTLRLGEHALTSLGGNDGFVAKLSGDGTVRWVQHIGGSGYDLTRAVTVDGAGHCYVTGDFRSEITIGGKHLIGVGKCNTYVAKFDPRGALVWVTHSTDGWIEPAGIALDSNRNVFVTGTLGASARFGNHRLTGSGGDMFLAKFDPLGSCVWAVSPGGLPGGRSGHRVAVDSHGNPHVVGLIERTTAFGSTNFVIVDQSKNLNVFAARFGANGEFHWVRQFKNGDFDFTGFVAADLATSIRSSLVDALSRFPTNQLRIGKTESSPAADREPTSLTKTSLPLGARPVVTLLVERVGDSLVLAWPKQFATHQLEGSVGIAPMPIWEPVPFEVQIVGDYRVVTIPLARALGFYRLRAP